MGINNFALGGATKYMATSDVASDEPISPLSGAPNASGLAQTDSVELITCESRNISTVLDVSLERCAVPGRLHRVNVCMGLRWPHNGHEGSSVKLRALAEYAATRPAHALLVYTDADALCNAAPASLSAEAVRKRWHRLARGHAHAVVYQAEPWCWAPNGPHQGQRQCSSRLLGRYRARSEQPLHPDWRCPRFLNGGAFAGLAGTVALMLHAQVNATGLPCYLHDDQCVATHTMLSAVDGALTSERALASAIAAAGATVLVDVHEVFFAAAAAATTGGVGCVACGNVRCFCGKRAEWARDATTALPPLARPTAYHERCNIPNSTFPPLFIHPNGPAKPYLMPALLHLLNLSMG